MNSSNRNTFRFRGLSLALGLCLASLANAQSNTAGAVSGHASAGDSITIENPETGFSRTITVDANGNYRFSALPPGRYTVTRKGADGSTSNREATVNVGTASNIDFVGGADATNLDTVTVVGTSIVNPIDTSSVESNTILTKETIDKLPVGRSYTAVALLAPGTVKGDGGFGDSDQASPASFGGSSVGENAYFINGFNVTNFRNGLGGSTVPFDFYEEFQVKTGGYGAEFGRSTGGVINTITKRGTNEWKFGARVDWEPEWGNEHSPDVFLANGNPVLINRADKRESKSISLYGGGPIIKDRLFFYALYNPRDVSSEAAISAGSQFQTSNSDDAFYGVKLDWSISDNHSLEYTGFSDKSETVFDTFDSYDYSTGQRGDSLGLSSSFRGGRNNIFKYTGYFGDNFTLSALYGKGQYNRTDAGAGEDCPVLQDRRTGVLVSYGCWTVASVGTAFDQRIATRLDAEWVLGSHQLRFGVDREENTAENHSEYSGGIFWRLDKTASTGTGTVNGVALGPNQFFVRESVFRSHGSFTTNTTAYYLEDSWQIKDNVLLYLGLRSENFENLNVEGDTFVTIKNQLAPRLGFSWDVDGDGTFKVFGNYGRYHLPVATNTNIRLAGNEYFVRRYFRWDGVSLNADGTPANIGAQIGPDEVNDDGIVGDVTQIVDQDIQPMYQDEMILGLQKQISEKWSIGVRAISRELKSTLDDIAIPEAAMNAWAARNGMTFGGFDATPYILSNPGQDVSFNYDVNGDGNLEFIELTAAEMGYPKAKRNYAALEFFFERAWDDKWFLQGSYTWAKSIGNTEGYVLSDRGTQSDAGLTVLFDVPQLTEYSYGYLPNDRRHALKLFGAYRMGDDFTVSGNLIVSTGRPKNCFGDHPNKAPDVSATYQGQFNYCDGVGAPRGTFGRNSTSHSLDVGLEYRPVALDKRFFAKVDVSNLLNRSVATKVQDQKEQNGTPNPAYRLPVEFQSPRSVRFTVGYDW